MSSHGIVVHIGMVKHLPCHVAGRIVKLIGGHDMQLVLSVDIIALEYRKPDLVAKRDF
jgi:hypothetical protein